MDTVTTQTKNSRRRWI